MIFKKVFTSVSSQRPDKEQQFYSDWNVNWCLWSSHKQLQFLLLLSKFMKLQMSKILGISCAKIIFTMTYLIYRKRQISQISIIHTKLTHTINTLSKHIGKMYIKILLYLSSVLISGTPKIIIWLKY